MAPAWPTPLFMMMSHGYLLLFFDISNFISKKLMFAMLVAIYFLIY
ncbi:hypothetical protein [Klebsiella pneumoniae IS46]|nr:hypothetical protein [Klebsiella pneumoniae IS46]